MSRETIKDGKMNVVGFVDKTCHGTRISDRNNNYKGSYYTKSNTTIDKSGKIHDCGMDHGGWLMYNWKPKMDPIYRINVQSHGDDERLLYVDEKANNGMLRKKLIAFAEDYGIKSIIWTNSVTNKGRLEQI